MYVKDIAETADEAEAIDMLSDERPKWLEIWIEVARQDAKILAG